MQIPSLQSYYQKENLYYLLERTSGIADLTIVEITIHVKDSVFFCIVSFKENCSIDQIEVMLYHLNVDFYYPLNFQIEDKRLRLTLQNGIDRLKKQLSETQNQIKSAEFESPIENLNLSAEEIKVSSESGSSTNSNPELNTQIETLSKDDGLTSGRSEIKKIFFLTFILIFVFLVIRITSKRFYSINVGFKDKEYNVYELTSAIETEKSFNLETTGHIDNLIEYFDDNNYFIGNENDVSSAKLDEILYKHPSLKKVKVEYPSIKSEYDLLYVLNFKGMYSEEYNVAKTICQDYIIHEINKGYFWGLNDYLNYIDNLYLNHLLLETYRGNFHLSSWLSTRSNTLISFIDVNPLTTLDISDRFRLNRIYLAGMLLENSKYSLRNPEYTSDILKSILYGESLFRNLKSTKISSDYLLSFQHYLNSAYYLSKDEFDKGYESLNLCTNNEFHQLNDFKAFLKGRLMLWEFFKKHTLSKEFVLETLTEIKFNISNPNLISDLDYYINYLKNYPYSNS